MRLHEKLGLKAAEESPDANGDGKISPAELHRHFDANGDGTVDMLDYARHINEHVRHPEYLAKETAQLESLGEKSAMARLKARLEKRALDMGEMAGAGLQDAVIGALPGALIGGLMSWKGGRGQMAHDAVVGALTGAIPGGLFGMYGNHQEQKARENGHY